MRLYRKDRDPRGYLEVEVLTVPMVGLLDSGATSTVIGAQGHSELDHKKRRAKVEYFLKHFKSFSTSVG